MPYILEDLSPGAIVKAMEANFFQYYWPYAELPQGEIHFEPGCTWFVSGVPERWFNGVLDTRFEENNLQGQVENILKHFRQKGLPLQWSIGPSTKPTKLDKALLAQGLNLGYEEPGMALDLLNMNEAARPPARFTIEPVLDLPALKEWVDVWMAHVPDPVAQHCREVIYRLGIDANRPWRTYLGRLDGKSVATIRLFYAAGVVSLHHVATLSQEQGKGIATALAVHALREARNQGYRVAVLTSTPVGLTLYQKIGFRTYTTFSGYSWRPGQ